MAIKTVWIEEGCIVCNACEAECPDVFAITDTTSTIKASVRQDGQETENRAEKCPLQIEFQISLEAGIEAAANGCPVEVIQFEKL